MPLREFERETAVKCLSTAIAADAIGEALSAEPSDFIQRYFDGGFHYFPTNRNDYTKTGEGGYNAFVCLCTVKALDDIAPVELEDVKYFHEELFEAITSEKINFLLAFRDKEAIKGKEDVFSTLPLAVATGVYSSLQDVSSAFCVRLYDSAVKAFGGAVKLDVECGRAMCYLVSNLLKTGYFGIETMQHLHDLDFYPERLSFAVDEILAHPLDAEYLNGHMSKGVTDGLSYSELVVAEVFFHMARVDTRYRSSLLKSTTKAQWPLMLCKDTPLRAADVCFAYGAVASASEQSMTVIKKPMRESMACYEYLKTLSV